MERKKIILVDDHVVVRSGLKELIEKLGPYNVVVEFDNGRLLVESFPFAESPDLIILDHEMPEMNGTQVVEWLHKNKIKVPVLLLTLTDDESLIIRLFRMGIRGYLHKNCSASSLRQALTDIFLAGYYHDEMFFKALTGETSEEPRLPVPCSLNDREMEFLRLVCDEHEYTYEQIASMMNAHRRTIDKYRESVFEKFGVKSKTGLVLYAVKHQLVEI